MIDIEQFKNVEMKVGKVLEASPVPDSNKLLLLKVSFGGEDIRTVVSGIAKYIAPAEMEGKCCVFVTNLPERPLAGYTSQAMILAVTTEVEEETRFSLFEAPEVFVGARVG